MINFEKQLINRKVFLEHTIKLAHLFLESAPDGKLRYSFCKNKERYYLLKDDGNKNGTYLNKNNIELVTKLAQKDYALKYIQEATTEVELINKLITQYTKSSPELIYDNLNASRKSLINPYAVSNEAYAQWWINQPYQISNKNPEEKIFPTNSGIFVRSGAEAFIANIYHELNIPFRYESLVKLKNGKIKAPDFTALDVKNRKIIYHEYMGMIDDSIYRQNNLSKLDEYRESGIYTGKNLILTFSGEGSRLNIPAIKKQIKEIFEIN